MRELTHKDKASNVAFFLMLISMLPVFVGFGAFEILDVTDVRGLREQGQVLEAFVWSLGAMVLVVIGVYVCIYVTYYLMRKLPGMRESILTIWEDDEGEPLPPPAPKPLSKEAQGRMNRLSMVISILIIVTVCTLGGMVTIGASEKTHEYFDYEALVEEGDIMALAVDALDAMVLIAVLSILTYVVYRFLGSDYGSSIKRIIPDPKSNTNEEGVEDR